ncbi:MAG: DUF1549 and DUF1553 domain-containing protein [Planctomycetes bacterium]|nr:DUF1549 and DUF1553 domain-containing protein [Planctomycetota bacterium]
MFACLRLTAVLAALAIPTTVYAGEPAPKADPAEAIAALIDKHISADWAARGIKPATQTDDAEFVRRVYLDMIGRAPKAPESREFIDDTNPNKRAALVDRLLTLPGHAGHFAAVTRAAWLPQTMSNFQLANAGFQFENWLRMRYRDNTPADEVVRRILTVQFTVNAQNPMFRFVQPVGTDPDNATLVGFYQANEARAENLGSSVSRLFVGVRLECAQCHDHPFAKYTREQFWEFAAFFAEMNPLPANSPNLVGPIQPQSDKNRITITNTEKRVVARFFDGSSPDWTAERSPRLELADWLTNPNNTYFSQNAVNRMWAHFFGIGIQDPVDEPGDNNPPSHPLLLEELAKAFVDAKFDNQALIRGITRSQAYQLSSKMTHPSQSDPRRFAKMNLKGLTPAQLFDSMVAATGHREPGFMRQNQFNFNQQPNNPRSVFLNRFASNEKVTEANTTILQALMLMNGQFITDVTSLEKGEVLAAIVDVPGWDTKQRITALFLSTFARNPSPEELEKFTSYVDRGGANNDKKKALADVFWVLLNSPEFLFNH